MPVALMPEQAFHFFVLEDQNSCVEAKNHNEPTASMQAMFSRSEAMATQLESITH